MKMTKSFWSELEDKSCPCKGTGWALRSPEWETCFVHYAGQLHPESKSLLLDDDKKLQAEERRSVLRWKIQKNRDRISILEVQLKAEQKALTIHELELINKTPTIKMKTIDVAALHLDLDWDMKSIPPGV